MNSINRFCFGASIFRDGTPASVVKLVAAMKSKEVNNLSDNLLKLAENYPDGGEEYEQKCADIKKAFPCVWFSCQKFAGNGQTTADNAVFSGLAMLDVDEPFNIEEWYRKIVPITEEIKEKGKKMVKKLNQYHICVDCAHISRNGFYDLADLAENLICSHTAFDAVRKHKRNITDEQIKIIIEKGGIIGLCLYNDFLTEKQIGEVDCIIRQIDYFVNKFGYKSLCFGSDFYGAKNFAGGINNYNKFSKIVEKLRKIGYNKNVIKDICFNNLNLFLEKVDARQKFIR